ncbi:rRNA-processing protein bfr2 [Exophiala oligosperma]
MVSLKERARELELTRRKDFDPEDDSFRRADDDDDDSEAEEPVDGENGREHYETVGKSTLREPEQVRLGAKYGGVAVSRKDLENEDEDEDDPFAPEDEDDEEEDPFAKPKDNLSDDDASDILADGNMGSDVDEDSEIDSDEALGESDVERFKNFTFRGSKRNRLAPTAEGESGDDNDEDEDSELSKDLPEEDSDLDMDQSDEVEDDDDDDDDDDDRDDSSSISSEDTPQNADRKALRHVLSSSTAGLASTLSAGANADVKKGHAVKKQRQTFDRLLDARIKLQRGVTATNDLDGAALSDDQVKAAAQKAEEAALSLWSTIDSIRCTILSAQDGGSTKSRKRPLDATRSTSLAELWNHTRDLETAVHPLRRSTLDKWHAKTQPAIDTAPRSKLLGKQQRPSQSRFTSVLDTYLTSEASKLVASSTPAPGTFDDGTFYQALLRDLITSRNANANADATGTAAGEPLLLPVKLKSDKNKNKVVETKASKGRKVRYTVHEKLENFMAPEDRSTWEDAARTEFFASLFGNRGALDEAAADRGDGQSDDDEDGSAEVEALRLFRS